MKRNSLGACSFKDYSTTVITSNSNSPIKESSYPNNKNQTVVKESWESKAEEYYTNGFPWPPRSYTCSFCRREFKSAQALGGHMNVHRRDRARLRQSPPIPTGHGQGPDMLNLNLNPTTNPNLISTSSPLSLVPSSSSASSSASTLKPPVTCTLPLFVSPMDGDILLNPLSTNTSEPPTKSKIAESLAGCGSEYNDANFAQDHEDEDGCKKALKKKAEILRMDLEMGLPSSDYDLDLELRLGTYYS